VCVCVCARPECTWPSLFFKNLAQEGECEEKEESENEEGEFFFFFTHLARVC